MWLPLWLGVFLAIRAHHHLLYGNFWIGVAFAASSVVCIIWYHQDGKKHETKGEQ